MTTAVDAVLEKEIVELTSVARAAGRRLANQATDTKNKLLLELAELLGSETTRTLLLEANHKDLEAARAKGTAGAMLDRLALDDKRIASMIQGLTEVVQLPDPVGVVRSSWTRPNGLQVDKRTIPLGVIGIIYEARPNVTIDAFALCFKAGNSTVLKGGSEAIHSNRALVKTISTVLTPLGLEGTCQFVDSTRREAVSVLLKQEDTVDVIIPRGGEPLIRFVTENSRIPVIKHYKGVCHIYVDEAADLEMAAAITENAKVSRPAVCNSLETLLVHQKVASTFLPALFEKLKPADVELRGDGPSREILPDIKEATEEDYYAEYLDLILAVRVVSGLEQAIAHIDQYGSCHTEAIVTENSTVAQEFLDRVNSSVVMVNASTRFSDGGELGLGAEIGISTSKLHAYGPMGLESLVAEKFVIHGAGQIRE
ncbi:MAG: glutamate-5-semialdehyde dehydrogenase [Acidobacteriota bacterium]